MKARLKEFVKRFRRPKTAALDFDRRRLRVVHFDASRWGPRIVALRTIPVPSDVDMSDADAAGTLVGRVLGEMGLAGADVLMNVPRSQAVLKALTLPAGTPEAELAGMVQYQIANELPFDAAEAVVDFTMTPHAGTETRAEGLEQGLDVLASAVRLPVVDYYRRLAEVAGLQPVKLCLRPASNLRCLDTCVKRNSGEFVALVDVTADETENDFVVGSSLVFSRSAPLAEDSGGGGEGALRLRLVQTVVSEVLRSLQSFQVSHRVGKLEGLLVAGESELATEVAAALSQKLEAKCEKFDPTRALDLALNAGAPAFSAALGSAVGAAENAGFDFLHPRRPAVRVDNRKTRVALIAATCGLAAMLLLLGCYALVDRQAKKAQQMKIDADAEESLWKDTVDPLSRRVVKVEDWQNGQIDWLGHLAQFSALLPGATEVYVSRLDTPEAKKVGLMVHARNRESIDQLEKLLASRNYHNKPGNVASRNDPRGLGYVFESTVQATLDPNALKQPAGAVPARPADDASGDGGTPSPAPMPAPMPPPAPAIEAAAAPQPSVAAVQAAPATAAPQMTPGTPGGGSPPNEPDPTRRPRRNPRRAGQ
jgi:Tfp pilus assembly PilM family ATPase